MSKPGASTEEPNQNQRDEFAAAIESKDLNLVTNRGVTRLRSCASCLYVASPPNRQTKWQSNSLTIRSVTFETKLNFELGARTRQNCRVFRMQFVKTLLGTTVA